MDNNTYTGLLGTLLSSQREAIDLSLRSISKQSGIDIKNLHQYENSIVSPTIDRVFELLPYYKLSSAEFLKGLESKRNIKKYLKYYIDKNHLNWSYSNVSDHEIISKILLYGGISQIKLLLRAYFKEDILNVWMHQYFSDAKYDNHNQYLMLIFFPNSNPYKKYKQLKNEYRNSRQSDASGYENLIS